MNGQCNHLALKFSVCVREHQDRLSTMYWLPKLHKRRYIARFIANSSSCSTTELSKLLTSCLTAVKNHVIRYCEKVRNVNTYISQLIRFARVSSHVADFNARNKSLTSKLLQQGYRYHKLRKTFPKFYRRHYELVSKFNVGLKTLLHQGLSEPKFYGDLVYKLKKKCR